MQTLTNPKTGETLESPYTDVEAARKLREKCEGQTPGDFLHAMLEAATNPSRPPSPAQRFWIHKLVAPPKMTDTGEAYDLIMAYLLKGILSGLKRPRLSFNLDNGKLVLSYWRKETEVFIAVRVDGRMVGKLTVDGLDRWKHCPDWAVEFLRKFCTGTVRVYGRNTGNCCFCARELTTGESVAMGYGPICADKYGLPWGEERARSSVDVDGEYREI